MSRLLVVDGAPGVRESARMILGGEHEVAAAGSVEEGARLARESPPDLILVGGPAASRRGPTEARAPWLEPLSLQLPPAVVARLVRLPMPFGVAELRGLVRRALTGRKAPVAGSSAGGPLAATGAGAFAESPLGRVLAAADPSGGLARAAARAARSTLPVLIVGERGTGREALARFLHAGGPLAAGRLVVASCAGLAAAELAARLGRLPPAPVRPTLLLKDLDEAGLPLQRALLELLESGTVGGVPGPGPLEVRPIALASERLDGLAERGLVAEPLLDALAVLRLGLPPLRERPAALSVAASAILEWIAREGGDAPPRRLSPAALERLALYIWPGNLRELASVLARSAVQTERPVLEPDDLDFGFGSARVGRRAEASETVPGDRAAPATPPAGVTAAPASAERAPAAEPDPARPTPPDAGDRFTAFAGELAHELKNPLVAIKTFTQLLGEKFDDPEFRREFYRVVRRDVERIDHLVEGILHASDAAPREVRPIDVNELVEDVLARSEPWMVERRVVAFKELADDLPPALADPSQARAAVFNVVARALASLPAGEDLFIGTRAGPPVRLSVTYRDTSPVGVGQGAAAGDELELTLARAALERAGGRLVVERDPGRRTTVTLEFPAPAAPAQVDSEETARWPES